MARSLRPAAAPGPIVRVLTLAAEADAAGGQEDEGPESIEGTAAALPPRDPPDIGVSYDELLGKFLDSDEANLPLLVARHMVDLKPAFFVRLQERRAETASAEERDELLRLAARLCHEMAEVTGAVEELMSTHDRILSTLLDLSRDAAGAFPEVPPPEALARIRTELRTHVQTLMRDDGEADVFVGTLHEYIFKADDNGHDDVREALTVILQIFAQEVLLYLCQALPWDGDEDVVPEVAALWHDILTSDERTWKRLIKKRLMDPKSKVTPEGIVNLLEFGGVAQRVVHLDRGSTLQIVAADFIYGVLQRVSAVVKTKPPSPPPPPPPPAGPAGGAVQDPGTTAAQLGID